MSRRTRVWLKYHGEKLSVAECARRIGISEMGLWSRLRRGVSTIELFAPGYGPRKPKRDEEAPLPRARPAAVLPKGCRSPEQAAALGLLNTDEYLELSSKIGPGLRLVKK